MKLINNYWDKHIEFTLEEPTILIIDKIEELFLFIRTLSSQIDKDDGELSLINIDKPLNMSKEVEFISDVFAISLNTRKTINYLYKELEKEIKESDLLFKFEALQEEVFRLLAAIKNETLLDIDNKEEISLTDIMKITGITFKERENSPLEYIIKYLQIVLSISKIKVIFIALAIYLLNEEDVLELTKFCSQNDIYLVFIEKNTPKDHILSNKIVIAESCVLI